ncbi:hypothetical protein FACS189475_03070 [Betaproteobacteria bacterium]|nr:hypothetical protein FACS189475_03070 [Betaproteobacteria bacterium]
MSKYERSIQIDLRKLDGKLFKVVADAIRSGIKNEHGFQATKGIRDNRLALWPIVIRFYSAENRDSFVDTLKRMFHPNIMKHINFKRLKPHLQAEKPCRWAANHF